MNESCKLLKKINGKYLFTFKALLMLKRIKLDTKSRICLIRYDSLNYLAKDQKTLVSILSFLYIDIIF
jgi:hypothetical protein